MTALLTHDGAVVPAEEFAAGMIRAALDSGASPKLDHIADESGLSRREVEAVRDWLLSGKKGTPPWRRPGGRIPPPMPRPVPAPGMTRPKSPPISEPAPVSEPTSVSVAEAGDPRAEVPRYPARSATAPGDPAERWRTAKEHPNKGIANLYPLVLSLIGEIEDRLDAEHEKDLLRVEEASLLAQLARVREKLGQDPAPRRGRPAKPTRNPGGAYACPHPGCDKAYPTKQGLGGHTSRAHQAAS